MVVANMVRALDVPSYTKSHTYILQSIVDKQSIFGEARHQSSGNYGVLYKTSCKGGKDVPSYA